MANLDLQTALASCNYYPVQINLGRRLIWFAEIDREMYWRAGFLVPKQAKMSEERYGFNLDDVLLYDLSLPIGGAPSHYVFITAFCCSTLLARLLDRVPGCLVLKEPGIVGQLGMMRYRPEPVAAMSPSPKAGQLVAQGPQFDPAARVSFQENPQRCTANAALQDSGGVKPPLQPPGDEDIAATARGLGTRLADVGGARYAAADAHV